MGVIDDYLEGLGDGQRAELERIRRIVLDSVPDAEEGRSYGMPAFRYKRKPLLGFAALKDHLSLYEVLVAVVGVVLHDVPQDRAIPDRHHRLGQRLVVLAQAQPEAAAEQNHLHDACRPPLSDSDIARHDSWPRIIKRPRRSLIKST
jgi:hypothetical protein